MIVPFSARVFNEQNRFPPGAPGGRMTAFASADGWLVLAFESDGRLL